MRTQIAGIVLGTLLYLHMLTDIAYYEIPDYTLPGKNGLDRTTLDWTPPNYTIFSHTIQNYGFLYTTQQNYILDYATLYATILHYSIT